MTYKLLNGNTLDLSSLPKEDLAFLLELSNRGAQDVDYFKLEMAVCATGTYPLKGSERVTKEVADSPLFQIAQDIVYRLGVRQGYMADR